MNWMVSEPKTDVGFFRKEAGRDRMRQNRTYLMMVVGFISVFMNVYGYCSDKGDEKWILYGKLAEGTEFYCDVKSIISVNPKVVQVWTKEKPSSDRRGDYIRIRKENGLRTDGWEKLNEVMSFQEMDCVKKTSKIMKTVMYDDVGNTLELITHPNPKPFQIVPDSMGEELLNGICP
jgi:hypothetical protein